MYTYIPVLLSLPPIPKSTHLGHHRALSWTPCAMQQLPTSYLNWYSHYGEQYGGSLKKKLKIELPYDTLIPLLGIYPIQFSSVQLLSHVQLLQPHGLQHSRPPYPSPTPGAYSNSCPSHQWCHPTILSPVVPFSFCLQSFPASGSLQMSQFFVSGGQSIGVSASASVLPMNIQDWFPLGWTGWMSLQSKVLSRVFSNTTVQKHQFCIVQLSHPYMTTGKTIALTTWTFIDKVMSLLFNMPSRLVITF